MTASAYGTPENYSALIQGLGEGASGAMNSSATSLAGAMQSKEAKRRTLANLISNSLKRRQAMNRVGGEYKNEMNDYQTNAMQQVAQGFVDALQGSTGRG